MSLVGRRVLIDPPVGWISEGVVEHEYEDGGVRVEVIPRAVALYLPGSSALTRGIREREQA